MGVLKSHTGKENEGKILNSCEALALYPEAMERRRHDFGCILQSLATV
jgi:hypothetical protein